MFCVDAAPTAIYTLSLHDALPISPGPCRGPRRGPARRSVAGCRPPSEGGDADGEPGDGERSEEHTSELQSRGQLVCRLLREKKNTLAPKACLRTYTFYESLFPSIY